MNVYRETRFLYDGIVRRESSSDGSVRPYTRTAPSSFRTDAATVVRMDDGTVDRADDSSVVRTNDGSVVRMDDGAAIRTVGPWEYQ